MTLLDELKVFVKSVLNWIYTFVAFLVFFFSFGPKEITVLGHNYFLPVPATDSFSVQIFNIIRRDLLPPGVQLVVTDPVSAFVSQILLSALLAFFFTIPFFIYKIILYIQPALLPSEKRAVLLAILPMVGLFFAGAAFSYYFLIPTPFKTLYPYAIAIEAMPFFSINEFIYYVGGLMIAVGLMFLLPVFMVLLSVMGIIPAVFWRRKWQYALLFFLVLSAIITPDGTGITMITLFLPLMALYLTGSIFANKLAKSV